MHTSSTRAARRYGRTASAVLGLLVAVAAATPAHAESIRDRQWHLDAMQAEQMWKTSTGKGITVAVIDSGVETLTELRGQVLDGKDFASDPGDEHDDIDGHGTAMAALISGTGSSAGARDGAYGLAPGAKILPVRVSTTIGGVTLDRSMTSAVRYAANSDAQIINISLGGGREISGMEDAVRYAHSKGKLVFASSGNGGELGNPVEYPGATPGVVAVAAVGRDVKVTKESTYGPQVDLAAPGDELVHACTANSGLCKSHGTSGATAIASASAALIWSKHPNWSNNQVLRVLLNTASKPKSGKERTDYLGYGAIRPRIALKNPGDPGPADEYPLPDFQAKPTKSPSSRASKPASGTDNDDTEVATPTAEDDNATTWIAVGAGTAALLSAGIAVAVVRSRRRTTNTE